MLHLFVHFWISKMVTASATTQSVTMVLDKLISEVTAVLTLAADQTYTDMSFLLMMLEKHHWGDLIVYFE